MTKIKGTDITNGSVANANLANMPEATVKGRPAGAGTGVPQNLTKTQLRAVAGVEGTFKSFSPEVIMLNLATSRGSLPRTAVISSVSSDIVTLTTSTATEFFSSSMDGQVFLRVTNTTRGTSAWIKATPASNQLQFTSASDISGWMNGDTITIGTDNSDITGAGNLTSVPVDISQALINALGALPSAVEAYYLILIAITNSAEQSEIAVSPNATLASFASVWAPPVVSGKSGGGFNTGALVTSPISASSLIFFRETGSTSINSSQQIKLDGIYVR